MMVNKFKKRNLKNNNMSLLLFMMGIAVESAVIFVLMSIAYFISILGFWIFS
jgi:hypothetical protein